jgi:fatty acid desaturase
VEVLPVEDGPEAIKGAFKRVVNTIRDTLVTLETTTSTAVTGLCVLAHECGHQAFSPSKAINDAVGWVLHTALLLPYHSLRISHGNHHKNTCSIEDDEVRGSRSRLGCAARRVGGVAGVAWVWRLMSLWSPQCRASIILRYSSAVF